VSALGSRPPPSAPKPAVLDLAAAEAVQDGENELVFRVKSRTLLGSCVIGRTPRVFVLTRCARSTCNNKD